MQRIQRVLFAVGVTAALGLTARAQENFELGKMWTFHEPPLAYLEEEYGFKPDQNWLDRLRMASIRFGDGCSSSFVSPKGLIMTNHHCVRDDIAKNQGENDWVKNGYVASEFEDEAILEGLTVQQLRIMTEVTATMAEGIADDADAETVAELREANEKRILEQAEADHPELDEFEVVSLFNGAQFWLYGYKVYDDVRLVMAPHLQTAHFGGDPDNFTYPRYSIDFAFCRAYEDGQPADTSGHYFKWSLTGPKDGEVVFVTGNPGSTGRLLTHAQMEYYRDAKYPTERAQVDSQLEILKRIVERIPQIEKALRTDILGLENTSKAFEGYHGGLKDETLMAAKDAAEAAFREKVMADPDLKARFGDAWKKLEEVSAQRTELQPKLMFQGTPPFLPRANVAFAILEATDPEATDEEKAAARESIRETLEGGFRGNIITNSLWVNHLRLAADFLGPEDPMIAFVNAQGPTQQFLQAWNSSKLLTRSYVDSMLEGGREAVENSDDVVMRFARVVHPLMEQNEALDEKLTAAEEKYGTLLGQALFAVYGTKVSPDATFSLRIADGVVKGYEYNGTIAPWRTTFYGLYGRSTNFDNEYPFNIPDAWLEAKDRIDMKKAVNFVSTNDIIGGNSGSPVVNKDLEVVGLIFDGNIEQLPNRFLYRSETARSVSVHVDAIVEALTKVYDAQRVHQELLDARKSD